MKVYRSKIAQFYFDNLDPNKPVPKNYAMLIDGELVKPTIVAEYVGGGKFIPYKPRKDCSCEK